MAGYEIVDVAMSPQDALEANLTNKVAAIINKNPYETRLLLAGQIPRVIAHCHSMQTAESIARNLRDLGLVVIVCKDSELRKASQSFMAHTLELKDKEVLTLVAQLREVFTQAIFDDKLAKRFRADILATKAGFDLELNCRLIYLYHLNTSHDV